MCLYNWIIYFVMISVLKKKEKEIKEANRLLSENSSSSGSKIINQYEM